MSDLIDRQQAIVIAVNAAINWHKLANPQYSIAYCIGEAMRQLPSAELGTNLAEVGTDLISRQAAIDYCEALMNAERVQQTDDWGYGRERYNQTECIMQYIENMPSAEPKIVRCKDCKHWIPYDWMFSEIWQSKNIADYPEDEIGCNWSDMAMKANDFCSRAERRTE